MFSQGPAIQALKNLLQLCSKEAWLLTELELSHMMDTGFAGVRAECYRYRNIEASTQIC